MYAFISKERFAAAGPAATAVLRHRERDAEIKGRRWRFERGTVSGDGRASAWAEFSDEADYGKTLGKLSIRAEENKAGGWTVTHSVRRAVKP
ncbi:hypothetical protein [Variovorax rhizosphaerae]|uniref:Uncharacterized protein n=1 Tax=Variovorax rhizosphaerae TaxID=1836200 RepID=A0ABU8WYI7_9BURK